MATEPKQTGSRSTPLAAILHDAHHRARSLLLTPIPHLLATTSFLTSLPPRALAGYTSLNDTPPTYNDFSAAPDAGWYPSDAQKIAADVQNFIATNMDYPAWLNRAHEIRKTGKRFDCVGNLSVALNVGQAYSSGMASANTLLSLIPTAGVLIGAPAKELWVLYKLCPLAGVLSNMLALGGSIVPREVGEYEKISDFQYQGLVAVEDKNDDNTEDGQATDMKNPAGTVKVVADGAEKFAQEVYERAHRRFGHGTRPTLAMFGFMFAQLSAIGMIIGACFFLQGGAVLVWWCEVSHRSLHSSIQIRTSD
jgi:hypothetical protein